MTDGTGSSSYVHDPFGELTSATNGAGKAVGYGYNADGTVSAITYPLPSGAAWATTSTVNFTYDNAGLLTKATDFNGHAITIASTADGTPSSVGLGSTGDTITTTYDNTDTPSAISLKNSTSTLQSFSYTDSPAGTILSECDTSTGCSQPSAAYTYDAAGRVTSMTPNGGTALSYGFDASGNLTTLPGSADASSGYDHASELTSSVLSGVTTTYSYNADGQQLTAAQGDTTLTSATWNGAAQLTSYNDAAANMTAATYDGNGLRASVTTTPAGGSAATQNFVWDQDSHLIMDSANAYIYTYSNAPAEQVNLSTGAISYLAEDSLGSVRGIVSSSGSLTAATSYDAWGNPEIPGGLSSSTPLGYAGGYTDPTGLIYLINRYYDPATGQFISVDPDLALTQAPYAYAGGNPVTNTDTTGLTLESYHCSKSSGGIKVNVCVQTWAILFHGQWYGQTTFHPDKNIIETGAKAIGLDVCDAHRKHCHHNSEQVNQPRAQWVMQCNQVVCYNYPPWLVTPSALFFTGSNWVYAWVAGAWAELSSGKKSKPVTLRDKWVKTCSHACN